MPNRISPRSAAASSCTRRAQTTCHPGAIRPACCRVPAIRSTPSTFVGAGHAIRRSAWDACGGYDEALFFCWEEFDFCLRAIERAGASAIAATSSSATRSAPSSASPGAADAGSFRPQPPVYRPQVEHSWLSLMPRYLGYLLKGASNGVLLQTLQALPAAMHLAASNANALPDRRGTRLFRANDTTHRGSWLTRLHHEY